MCLPVGLRGAYNAAPDLIAGLGIRMKENKEQAAPYNSYHTRIKFIISSIIIIIIIIIYLHKNCSMTTEQ